MDQQLPGKKEIEERKVALEMEETPEDKLERLLAKLGELRDVWEKKN